MRKPSKIVLDSLDQAMVIAAEVRVTPHPSILAAMVITQMMVILAEDQGCEATRQWMRETVDTMPDW